MTKKFLKHIFTLLLISVICALAVSCTPKNELICENEEVGEAWKKYVLNHKENVNSVDVYPLSDNRNSSTSSTLFVERYKISDRETLNTLLSLLIEIGDYAAEIGNREDLLKDIIAGEYSSPICSITFNPKDPQNSFIVSLYENLIIVLAGNTEVIFITEENTSELIDDIMNLVKDNGVYTTGVG